MQSFHDLSSLKKRMLPEAKSNTKTYLTTQSFLPIPKTFPYPASLITHIIQAPSPSLCVVFPLSPFFLRPIIFNPNPSRKS